MNARPTRSPRDVARDVDALVLSSADSRDDRILRVLTVNDEVIPVVARGVRRAGKNAAKAAILQPLSEVTLRLSGKPGADIAVIDDVWLNEPHDAVKHDLVRLAVGSVMVEAMLHLVPEHAAEDGLHVLATRALRRLGGATEAEGPQLCCLFLVRLLDLSGVLPEMDEEGGPAMHLSAEAKAVLTDWRRGRWRTLGAEAVRPTLVWLERQVTGISLRPLKSQEFLDSVLNLGPAPARPSDRD